MTVYQGQAFRGQENKDIFSRNNKDVFSGNLGILVKVMRFGEINARKQEGTVYKSLLWHRGIRYPIMPWTSHS